MAGEYERWEHIVEAAERGERPIADAIRCLQNWRRLPGTQEGTAKLDELIQRLRQRVKTAS